MTPPPPDPDPPSGAKIISIPGEDGLTLIPDIRYSIQTTCHMSKVLSHVQAHTINNMSFQKSKCCGMKRCVARGVVTVPGSRFGGLLIQESHQ